jgi:prephenate dehydrogenase
MSLQREWELRTRVGIIGFGAFGRVVGEQLAKYFSIFVYDSQGYLDVGGNPRIIRSTLSTAAGCSIVILAVPVSALQDAVNAIRPYLQPNTVVVDVCSVKGEAVRIMLDALANHDEIIATHPLFGPQSMRDGTRGLKIAVCPIRGRSVYRFAAFLKRAFGLRVIITTPEDHDREVAVVQGLTHFLAKAITRMEPLPTRLTTRSYELLLEAVNMVRSDAPEVFDTIERVNEFSSTVRARFLDVASDLDAQLSLPAEGADLVGSLESRAYLGAAADGVGA